MDGAVGGNQFCREAVSFAKQRRIIQNYILRYKNAPRPGAFFEHYGVKFKHRGHGDKNAKITETNIIWRPFYKIDF